MGWRVRQTRSQWVGRLETSTDSPFTWWASRL